MISLKRKCINTLHLKWKPSILSHSKKANVYYLNNTNRINSFNNYLLKNYGNCSPFSTSKNPDYLNHIKEINSYIEIFEKKENEEKPTSENENILTVLQKIKKDKKYEENEDIIDIISSIKLLIEKRVRPIIVNDGGDIKFVCFDFDDGIVYVQLEGACVSCSQSEMTLQYMIKNMLTYYISEIKEIKNVSKDGIILK